MKATIEIKMGNSAFSEYPGVELARILDQLSTQAKTLMDASQVEHHEWIVPIKDTNGNTVGSMVISS